MTIYYKVECDICGKRIGNAGFATVAHNRKHVREGILIERMIERGPWKSSRIRFERTTDSREIQAQLYPREIL